MQPPPQILTVTELNRSVRGVLETRFPLVWVTGEISNLARPASGHLYFSLKDAGGQVRCALFKSRAMLLKFPPANGMQVTLRGRVSLYEPRGDFQLIAEHMEEAGLGALQRAFDALKKRLHSEGLFDPARKKTVPPLPRCIGLITSPSGAAIRDILTILRRRCAAIPVLVYPVAVQGEEAPPAIVRALQMANRRRDCDVLVVARGGGSLEDLWAFNNEAVARAIAASELPVVSAVGHEIDFTIADFTADARAPTPSAAAELLSPDSRAWLARVLQLEQRLHAAMQRGLTMRARTLAALQQRLQHPGRRLQMLAQRLDELHMRLPRALAAIRQRDAHRLHALSLRLERHNPQQRLQRLAPRLTYLRQRLAQTIQQRLAGGQARLAELSRALDAVSPLATLERGYAIVSNAKTGTIIRDAQTVTPGSEVTARLAQGRLQCQVKIVEPD